MIQNNIIDRLKRDAIAQLQFEKIKQANEERIAKEQEIKPKLLPPKMSLAEVRFWETYEHD
jgi:alpha-N-acetylglucosamine transferase